MGLTAVYRFCEEGYIAFVEEIPGVNAQGRTLAEARGSLREALELVLAANRDMVRDSIGSAKVIREPIGIDGRRGEPSS
ncbi:type II toxin-antitoxin system HicB family antitoxin [Myxococcota bacterium]|nr:type II toxin-antitoxin system HicB family antitoxin [Myxococcota bacterium]